VSNTDLVNSGSYLTALFVVVFGIATFAGFGGSFLITGFAVGFIDTKDLGSNALGFFATGFAAAPAGTAGLTSGLATDFTPAGVGDGFLAGMGFLATGTDLIVGLATGFLAGFAAGFPAFTGAFAAGFAAFLAGFFGAVLGFLLAIH
jgi:hypothetical protein